MKRISLTRLSRSLAGLSRPLNYRLHPPRLSPSTPEEHLRFGLYRFRSPLLTVSISLSFPPLTEMFHFSGSRVHNPMDSGYDDDHLGHQVTPFGYPRFFARLQLPEAFRSLLRPSSPVGTKAFTISP